MRNKNVCIGLVGIVALLSLTGCLQDQQISGNGEVVYEDITLQDLDFNVVNFPKVDGSTSTHPLDVLIACKTLNISYHWSESLYSLGGYNGTSHIFERDLNPDWVTGKGYIAQYINEYVVHHGTHDAYVNLIDKTSDVILVARSPSSDELALANTCGVELVVNPVALDAFVFLLHENNTVSSLTVEQLQGIYTGTIRNWSDVGGNISPIKAYQREMNSGSQELMKSLVMNDFEMINAPEMILYTMMGPYNQLDSDVNGIGYSVYFFKEFMTYGAHVKTCAINGVLPNQDTIRGKTYPFTAEVYVVIRSDLEEESTAYQLRDWLLNSDGQVIVDESGYVPLNE